MIYHTLYDAVSSFEMTSKLSGRIQYIREYTILIVVNVCHYTIRHYGVIMFVSVLKIIEIILILFGYYL